MKKTSEIAVLASTVMMILTGTAIAATQMNQTAMFHISEPAAMILVGSVFMGCASFIREKMKRR